MNRPKAENSPLRSLSAKGRARSIAKRWAVNTMGSVLLVLLILSAVTVFMLQQGYYDTVRAALESAAANPNAPIVFIQNRHGGANVANSGAAMLDSFAELRRMGVWFYDGAGQLVLASDGTLSPNADLPPELAADRAYGQAELVRLPSGERVLTLTQHLTDEHNNFLGTVRYLTSVDAIDQQLLQIAMILSIASFVAIGLLLLTGVHFVRTILTPIGVLAETAEKIAAGDLKARVPTFPQDDELARLCGTVNTMAENLELSGRTKDDFVTTISHELRTPLTAIRGWSETLREDENARGIASLQRGLSIIQNEATRLARMVEDLLDFSRMQSGRFVLCRQPLDVLAELDDVIYTYRESALRSGVQVKQKVPEYPARLDGDPARLHQVFINILDNAVKYNRPGGSILVEAQLLPPDTVRILISDTGRGIKPEDLPHVKEKFYKAEKGIKGSGIGLAVADEIVRQHGGSLELESVFGEGTTVTITLPVEAFTLPEIPAEIQNLIDDEQPVS
ncbi:MAG: HAMP domain-containing histidine kinase [Oscillospiraceae bacterium]|jgi:signal transduction histidine kinase|nr:HAMP domain-containing histidine kinase [Oscillospiraceae bacterium]